MERIMVLVLEESDRISAEMIKPLLANVKKDNEGVLPVARKLAEGVLLKSADKLKPNLMPATVSLGDTSEEYTKVAASVCEGKTATVEHSDEVTSGVQQATECKLVKESKFKAHQADEIILTTTSSDHTGQVFKKGACLKEVDSTLDRSLKSVMINGVDGMGNQEASFDLETSNKSEEEVINQEGDKKHTEGSILDKESKPEDQASRKRGKEDDTVMNSTESVVGLADKRASAEISDGSAKKIRVSRVVRDSCLAPSPVTCSDATVEGRESDRTASGHLPLGDKDVMRNPSHQMFLPGASIPTAEERVRKMGRSGVVDQLQGIANESAALFSHAADSIHALELDHSELERQLNEFILRDKGYHEKISVLEREVSDLKSLGEQMKLNLEARVVDAERRALEAETKLAVAKRKMVEAEGTMKAALASFAL
uniref:uncharacterized protein LOC122599950 n=1 Tax=Erigeron canadensis TaxID=72917 RepID=UPI001CB8C9B5|nr:uncharacterized protein LOC122599950 [Erigeron canadensis]